MPGKHCEGGNLLGVRLLLLPPIGVERTMYHMELSRKIVNAFYLKRERSEDYVVRVEYSPNPLDFDGCDAVSAFVVRKDRVGSGFNTPKSETVVLTCKHAKTVEDALTQLAQAAGIQG